MKHTGNILALLAKSRWIIPLLAALALFAGGKVRANSEPRPPIFVSWGGIGSVARVKAAAKMGVNLHRLPIGWPDENGRYDFREFDRMIRALHEAHITVIVHFFNHGVPQWFWKKHPNAAPRDASGETTHDYPSPWNPYVRAAIESNMSAILEHLKAKHLLKWVNGVDIGVGMEGQLSFLWDKYRASDPYALKAWRKYLETNYNGDLAQLNRDWGTNYTSWDTIPPPKQWEDTMECHSFERFYKTSILNAALDYAQVVRRYFHPRIWFWVSHFIKYPERHYAARYPRFFIRRLKALGMANIVETSSVPGWETLGQIRRLKDVGVRVIGEIHIGPSLEGQAQDASTSMSLGCDGFFVGTLENLITDDGKLTPVGEETAKLIREWKAGRDDSSKGSK